MDVTTEDIRRYALAHAGSRSAELKTDHQVSAGVVQSTVNMENGNTYEFDLVTIGAGSGGTRASRFSAQHYGAKVAVVELPFGMVASDDTGGAGGT